MKPAYRPGGFGPILTGCVLVRSGGVGPNPVDIAGGFLPVPTHLRPFRPTAGSHSLGGFTSTRLRVSSPIFAQPIEFPAAYRIIRFLWQRRRVDPEPHRTTNDGGRLLSGAPEHSIVNTGNLTYPKLVASGVGRYGCSSDSEHSGSVQCH